LSKFVLQLLVTGLELLSKAVNFLLEFISAFDNILL
jgi:hypothetical protein